MTTRIHFQTAYIELVTLATQKAWVITNRTKPHLYTTTTPASKARLSRLMSEQCVYMDHLEGHGYRFTRYGEPDAAVQPSAAPVATSRCPVCGKDAMVVTDKLPDRTWFVCNNCGYKGFDRTEAPAAPPVSVAKFAIGDRAQHANGGQGDVVEIIGTHGIKVDTGHNARELWNVNHVKLAERPAPAASEAPVQPSAKAAAVRLSKARYSAANSTVCAKVKKTYNAAIYKMFLSNANGIGIEYAISELVFNYVTTSKQDEVRNELRAILAAAKAK